MALLPQSDGSEGKDGRSVGSSTVESKFVMCPLAVLLLAALPGNVHSQAMQGAIESCTKIEDPAARLDCYDALAGRPKVRAEEVGQNWNPRETINPLDDTKTMVATNRAVKRSNR